MNSVKKTVILAIGIFWLGTAAAIAIPSYGTHAGPRHPNPSIVVLILPLMVAGLTGAFKLARNKTLIVSQTVFGLTLIALVIAMDQRSIGPNWPAFTCSLSTIVLGITSMVMTSLMKIGD